MQKVDIPLSIESDKMEALEFILKKENTSVKSQMDKSLKELYERSVPEAVREYLDSKVAAARPKRSARSLPKSKEMEQKEKEGVIVHEEP